MNENSEKKIYIKPRCEDGFHHEGRGRGRMNRGRGMGRGMGRGYRHFSHALRVGEEGHLSDLRRGQKCVVLNFHNDNKALRRRLLDMGITKGVVIEIKKTAPLGDPIDLYIRGYELCLRKADMRGIDIKVIE